MDLNIRINELNENDICSALSTVDNPYFNIENYNEYAKKIVTLAQTICLKDDTNNPISFILYYNNQEDLFISMVWTHKSQQGKSYAKMLLDYLIKNCNKDIVLEVNKSNPAVNLYKKLKFEIIETYETNYRMKLTRRLSIMQPYCFPYIGYFNLIEASDKIIFYDDVNFINRGWINRNRIIVNGKDYMFTIPLKDLSQNKLINEIKPLTNDQFKNKFIKQIEMAYSYSANKSEIIDRIISLLDNEYNSIAELAVNSIKLVYDYIGLSFKYEMSSINSPHTKGMEKADRLISICKENNYKNYVNPIGGVELYSKEYFKSRSINLNFLKAKSKIYNQKAEEFIPFLSIIDIMMNNSKEELISMIRDFEII